MLENLFLDYANYSLREDPRNLNKIFEGILDCPDGVFATVVGKGSAKIIVERIIHYALLNDPETADKDRKEIKIKPPFDWLQNVAFEAVYKYRGGYCGKKCNESIGIDYRELLRKNGLPSSERLKCFECHQLAYVGHLSELSQKKTLKDMIMYLVVDGKRCRVIGGRSFEGTYLRYAYDCVTNEVYISDDGELIKSSIVSFKNLTSFDMSSYDLPTRFADFLNSLVGYSLTEFLLHNDQRKLKRCEDCGKFYVSKTVRPSRFCSTQCHDAFHNRRRIESGEAKEYKRKKRAEGALSYY